MQETRWTSEMNRKASRKRCEIEDRNQRRSKRARMNKSDSEPENRSEIADVKCWSEPIERSDSENESKTMSSQKERIEQESKQSDRRSSRKHKEKEPESIIKEPKSKSWK